MECHAVCPQGPRRAWGVTPLVVDTSKRALLAAASDDDDDDDGRVHLKAGRALRRTIRRRVLEPLLDWISSTKTQTQTQTPTPSA